MDHFYCYPNSDVLITSTVFAMSAFDSIIERLSSSDSTQDVFNELRKLSIDELISETNTLTEIDSEESPAMYHAMMLRDRMGEISAQKLLEEAEDESNTSYVRSLMLKLYTEKSAEKISFDKVKKFILDESEDYEVRVMAISKLPSTEESIEFLEKIFWETDEDISYRILKRLWVARTPVAEDIADMILMDYAKYSPQKICGALVAKSKALYENFKNRSYDELLMEKEAFTDIAIRIHETYPDELIPNEGDTKINYLAANPVTLATSSLSKVRCEKAVKYMVMEFPNKTRLSKSDAWYETFAAVNYSANALAKLASSNPDREDTLFLIEAVKYAPYKEITTPLKKHVETLKQSKTLTSEELEKINASYITSTGESIPDYGTYIDSWRW